MSLIIGIVACLVSLYIIWVITKKIVMAVFFALVVGGIVYVAIPMLAQRDDGVGKAAQTVNEVRKKAQDKTIEVIKSPKTKEALDAAKKKASDLANKPAVKKGVKATVEAGKKAVEAGKKAVKAGKEATQ